MYSNQLSDTLRCALQPMSKFRQFADVKDAAQAGKKKGETFTWNVYSDVANQGGTVTETNTLGETNFTITQGTLTVTEYGQAVPFSGKVTELAQHDVQEVVSKALKNDALKAFDSAAYDQFNATKLRVVPTSGTSTTAVDLTTDGTATETNNIALGKEHVKLIVDVMKERNIPAYSNGDYYCIAWPSTLRTLKNDLESIKQNVDEGFDMIMNGELGRYEGTRFVEQTQIDKASWTNSKSDWAFFFGDDAVAEGIVVPEEVRAKIPTDYGRSNGIAWYYLGGFGIVRTQAADATIVKWDSAA
jgi:N4-gp56 family major capsid protein